VRFLSDQGVALLRLRLQEAVTKWWPHELAIFNAVWESFQPFLERPLTDQIAQEARSASMEEPLPKGLGFAAEELHNYATPHLVYLMSAVFAHLVGEQPSSEISESRIREVIKAYASRRAVPGCSEQDVVAKLTPLLWADFRHPPAGLTYTPETFVVLDSTVPNAKPTPARMEEIDTWRARGEKRWLFFDDMVQTVVIGRGKARQTFYPGRQTRRLLREILLRVSVGAVARETLYSEVWGETDVEPGTFREAFSSMHGQTGGMLKEKFRLKDDQDMVRIEMPESFLAIWLAGASEKPSTRLSSGHSLGKDDNENGGPES